MNWSQKRVCQPSRSEAVFCHKAVTTTYCHRLLQSYSEITLHGRVIEHKIIYVRHFDTHNVFNDVLHVGSNSSCCKSYFYNHVVLENMLLKDIDLSNLINILLHGRKLSKNQNVHQ